MSDSRTSPATQARYAAPTLLDLRGMPEVYGSWLAEVHAPRQAAAPYARAIVGRTLRVSNVTARAELDQILEAPTYRNGLRLMAPHYQQP
jgi:hypothetical protein